MYKSEKIWDRLVKNYDKETSNSDQTHNKTIEKIEEYINESNIVLDFGCATGGISLDIASKVKEIQGIDISSKMIQAANLMLSREMREPWASIYNKYVV